MAGPSEGRADQQRRHYAFRGNLVPIWPIWMTISAALMLWGLRHNAWQIPALALCGYLGMRFVIYATPQGYHEVIASSLWLCIGGLMMYKGAWVPGFLFVLSAMTYPVFLTFGLRIEYMGLLPIFADFFAALALISIAGGLYGMATDPPRDTDRLVDRLASNALGMAAR